MPLRKLRHAALAVISVAALTAGAAISAAPNAAAATQSCDYVTNGFGFVATVTAPVAVFVYKGSDCSGFNYILEGDIAGIPGSDPFKWQVEVTDKTCDATGATLRSWYTDGVQFHLDSLGCGTTRRYKIDPSLLGTPSPNNWWLEVTCSSPCKNTNSHAYPLPNRKPF